MILRPSRSPLFPYTTLFRSRGLRQQVADVRDRHQHVEALTAQKDGTLRGEPDRPERLQEVHFAGADERDRKSTRLNSSHLGISYAVFCLKKKTRLNTESHQ